MFLRKSSFFLKRHLNSLQSALFIRPSLARFSNNNKPNEPASQSTETKEKDILTKSNNDLQAEASQEGEGEGLSLKDLTFLEVPKSKAAKVRDEHASPTVVKFDLQEGYKINTEVEFQLKDNPLALKVMKEGKLDLKDKRIEVNTLSMADANLLDPNSTGDLKQVNLGDIKVLPKDSVMLEDIDVYNIPEDKDIVIEKEEKTLYAVGRKVQRKEELKIVKEGEPSPGKEVAERENEGQVQWVHEIGKKIFEEKTFDEFKKENLFSFEAELVKFNYKEAGRILIGMIPLAIMLGFTLHTFVEVYACKRDDMLIEEQEMGQIADIRKRLARNVLLNNPLFDRKNFNKAS